MNTYQYHRRHQQNQKVTRRQHALLPVASINNLSGAHTVTLFLIHNWSPQSSFSHWYVQQFLNNKESRPLSFNIWGVFPYLVGRVRGVRVERTCKRTLVCSAVVACKRQSWKMILAQCGDDMRHLKSVVWKGRRRGGHTCLGVLVYVPTSLQYILLIWSRVI